MPAAIAFTERVLICCVVLGWSSAARAQLPRVSIARIFAEGSVRLGTGPAHVPYEGISDETGFGPLLQQADMPWHVQAGGMAWVDRWLTYGAARVDGFRPVLGGASPWVVSAMVGVGGTAEHWDEGGEYQHSTTTHERRNKWTGQVCERPGDGEVYADGCVEHWSVTRTENRYEPPGMVRGWYAFHGGWRQAFDMRIDGATDLASGGGPVLGVTTSQRKESALAFHIDLEAAYYAVGPKHGLAASGRFGAGLPWLFFDLVGRLDGVTGNELSFGVALRLAIDP